MEQLKKDKRVEAAGIIGSYFHIDPLAILNSTYYDWTIRRIAYELAVSAENKAYEEAKHKK